MRTRPRRLGKAMRGRIAAEIAQIVRYARDLTPDQVHECGRRRRIEAAAFERGIDRDFRILPQDLAQAGSMIVVTVGDRNKIETFQVNAERGYIVSEVGSMAACI